MVPLQNGGQRADGVQPEKKSKEINWEQRIKKKETRKIV